MYFYLLSHLTSFVFICVPTLVCVRVCVYMCVCVIEPEELNEPMTLCMLGQAVYY